MAERYGSRQRERERERERERRRERERERERMRERERERRRSWGQDIPFTGTPPVTYFPEAVPTSYSALNSPKDYSMSLLRVYFISKQ
jgi:hypothetical protein